MPVFSTLKGIGHPKSETSHSYGSPLGMNEWMTTCTVSWIFVSQFGPSFHTLMSFQTCTFFFNFFFLNGHFIVAKPWHLCSKKHNKTTLIEAHFTCALYYELSVWSIYVRSRLNLFFSPSFVLSSVFLIGLSFPFAPLMVAVTDSAVVEGTAKAHHQIRGMDRSSMTTGGRKVNTCWSLQHNCEAFLWGQHSVWVKVTK